MGKKDDSLHMQSKIYVGGTFSVQSRVAIPEVKRTYGSRAVILSGSQTINPDFVPPPSVYVPGRSPESVQDTRDEQS